MNISAVETLFGAEENRVMVLVILAWVFLSVILHRRAENQQKSERKIKAEKNAKFLKENPLKLPARPGKGEWVFFEGREHSLELVGGGKGRSSWIPTEEDKCETFNFDREKNANAADRVYRAMMLRKNEIKDSDLTTVEEGEDVPEPEKAATVAARGSVFHSRLQTEGGFWPGDYGGPMFLLPGLVIACYVTGIDLGEARRSAMLRYIMVHQQEVDGGWGMHIEGNSTVFGSTLNYTAARLLGLKKDDPRAARARDFIKSHGGAVAAPQWAKFWLATLGAYEWTGVNPTPPELWMLPYWFPFHPGRMWCHCRMVYLPMSALFGDRFVYENAETDPLVLSLREELFETKYDNIAWGNFSVRECVAETDIYNPQSWVMTAANHFLHNTIENPWLRAIFFFPFHALRKRAVKFAFSYIHAEDMHTNWVDIGPVSKAFHIVANYAYFGAESEEFQRHIARIDDYLWLAEDGLKMQGYNGSMFWDTCFATHALANAVVASKMKKNKDKVTAADRSHMYRSLVKASMFVDDMQVREDVWERHSYFRDKSKGGWPFSSRDHGWPISDCTAEGIKAAILLGTFPDFKSDKNLHHISQERLEDAVSIILELQNTSTDNGWASYELNRGYSWYELFNPAQVFGDIMIDYSYVECSSAATQALCEFAHHYPESKFAARALESAVKGARFVVSTQRADGSWYGSWGVCFCYAGWFGVEGLAAVLTSCEISVKDKQSFRTSIRRGCDFILSKQNKDGGWGESVRSCSAQEWIPNENGSQVIGTAWCMLALLRAIEVFRNDTSPDKEYIDRLIQVCLKGSKLLRARQLPNGDWNQESISGMFNKSCSITYTAYRNVFPIWALARVSIVLL